MGNKVVLIDNSDSFIVRSIAKCLESMGYEYLIVDWSVDELSSKKEDFSDIVIAYIDDIDEIDKQAIVYLRDLCIEDCHGLYLAGHSDDIEDFKTDYGITQIAGTFPRPINANDVADQISKSMKDNPMVHRSHVLVVDDSGTMLNTIQEWLGEKYRVSVVNSAMNAITFLGKSTPDLILLDYEMPSCSGPQLLEMLRADYRTESIPVIFLTGKDDPESVKRVLDLKPSGYLLKNMPKEYIISQVDQFFEKQKML